MYEIQWIITAGTKMGTVFKVKSIPAISSCFGILISHTLKVNKFQHILDQTETPHMKCNWD